MTSEAQKKAVKKYKEKVKRITIDFYPTEMDLYEHIQNQSKKQTYIKDLIRNDTKSRPEQKQGLWIREDNDGEIICTACGGIPCGDEHIYHCGEYCPNCGAKMRKTW